MKHILFFLMLLLPSLSLADLDETTIRSKDQKCAIHYLTQSPIKGQTIHTTHSCPNGWMHGYGSVEIHTPNHPTQEILTGFFMDGYWLGSFPAHGSIQDRQSPEENIQTLTFVLDTDQSAGITYLVQLRAIQSENRIYSPFMGCPVFRLLVVVPDIQVFEDEAFQDKIATQAIDYAKHLCSDLEVIAIFGTKKMNAKSQDIVFQMQIDTDTWERTIIPIQHNTQDEQEFSENITDTKFPPLEFTQNSTDSPNTKNQFSETDMTLTSLNHLNIQSKLNNQPVQGRIIVHIQSVNLDGSANVDLPQQVLLKYHPNLKIGWAIIQGRFYKNQMHVFDIQFCKQEWCSDVP